MDANRYQTSASEFAIYPGRGQFTGFLYTVLGLCGEAGELQEKVANASVCGVPLLSSDESVRVEISKELGDLMWYASQMAWEMNNAFSFIMQPPCNAQAVTSADGAAHRISIIAMRIAERAKKTMRDFGGHLDPTTKDWFRGQLQEIVTLINVVCYFIEMPLGAVCNMNIEKLTSRKARNVLGGNGDNR